jgi:hypothetical protein
MSLLAILLPAAAILATAYVTYGRLLARLFRLDPAAATPAVTLRDDVDYEPIPPQLLLGQHFSGSSSAASSSAASTISRRSSPRSVTRPARLRRSSATT